MSASGKERSVEDVVKELKTSHGICQYLESEKNENEERALAVVRGLIGTSPRIDVGQYTDKRHNKGERTALHCAVDRKFLLVCEVLIRHRMSTTQQDKTPNKTRPITSAIQGGDDDLAELLVRRTEKSKVRELMLRQNDIPEINIHTLLQRKDKESMPKTIMALLDCLQEEWRVRGKFQLHYTVLEADANGNMPRKDQKQGESVLCFMAKNKQKDFLQHLVVQELVKRKWNKYGRKHYRLSFIVYIATLFCLTFSMATSVYATNVLEYTEPWDYARAVFEVISYLCVCVSLVIEIIQMVRERKQYLVNDKYNIFESISAILLFAALFVRFTHVTKHWYFFSVGYLFWVLRVFKYATLFRRMATYVDCLWQLVIKVFPQFATLFLVLNLAFGGALVLGLKGDQELGSNNETRNLLEIWLTGTRTLTSGEPMFGDATYRSFSTIILMVFLFMILVVLLSILIAQLTDALPTANRKVDRNLTYKMARIIADIESETFDCIKLLDTNFWKKKCKRDSAHVTSRQADAYTPHDVIDIAKSISIKRQYCHMITPPSPYAPSGLPSGRNYVDPNDIQLTVGVVNPAYSSMGETMV